MVLERECAEPAYERFTVSQRSFSGTAVFQPEHGNTNEEGDHEGHRPGKDQTGAGARGSKDQDADTCELQDGAQAASPELRRTAVQSDRCTVESEPRHGRHRPDDEEGAAMRDLRRLFAGSARARGTRDGADGHDQDHERQR